MRLLLTGAQGFTGEHLAAVARHAGYEVFSLDANLQDAAQVHEQVNQINPSHVIHLAGISHVTAGNPQDYYQVNLLGSLTLLEALVALPSAPQKVILASSANVYGNNDHSPIAETELPSPISHYAMSKLAMEYMSQPFADRLPIVITRPFNYTGVGHAKNFIIPKIVDHFAQKAKLIELGNLEVFREYNDVRDVCQVYLKLLNDGVAGQTYNLASGHAYSLHQVISSLEGISGHSMAVKVNPQFVRANEILRLSGDPRKLESCIKPIAWRSLEDTLGWMLQSSAS
jgi:nucleoside-diphosphate-sugar epimerase